MEPCTLSPTVDAACQFESELQGTWYMFEEHHMTKIVISDASVRIDGQGDFVCRNKHWSKNHYKTVTAFTNGW